MLETGCTPKIVQNTCCYINTDRAAPHFFDLEEMMNISYMISWDPREASLSVHYMCL